MRNILDAGKFIVSLKTQQILVLVVAIIIGYLIYENRELRIQNTKKDALLDLIGNRFNDYVLSSTKKLEECEKLRVKDAAEIQGYFRKRVEQLEERAEKNYKKIR